MSKNFNDLLKFFNNAANAPKDTPQSKPSTKKPPNKNPPPQKIQNKNPGNVTLNPTKQKEEKLKIQSDVVSKDGMTIKKYPNSSFTKIGKCKTLLFLGNELENCINTFINMYLDVSYNDSFRYKIDLKNSNNNSKYILYDIKSKSEAYNLRIIGIPSFDGKNEILKNHENMLNLFRFGTFNNINYIFITLEENKNLETNELIFFYLFINLFNKGHLAQKIILLFSSNESKEINLDNDSNQIINKIFNDKRNDILFAEQFNKSFLPSVSTPEETSTA